MKLQSGYRMNQRDFTVMNEVHEKHRKSKPYTVIIRKFRNA